MSRKKPKSSKLVPLGFKTESKQKSSTSTQFKSQNIDTFISLSSSSDILRHLLSILLITLISISIYSNTLKNGFVYDDEFTIVNDTLIKNLNNLPKLFKTEYFEVSGENSYRPVVTLTYFIDYWLYGLKPWGYHLTNVLLHSMNGIILYVFLTLLFKPSLPVQALQTGQSSFFNLQFPIFNLQLLISLLFITHPVLTEAVNAISFREDLLCFLFYISALIIYIRGKSYLASYFLLLTSCFLYLLALLSKEMAITFPLIILLYEWLFPLNKPAPEDINRGGELRGLLFNRYYIGYIVITIFYLYLRFYLFHNPVEENIEAWSLFERLITIPYLILKYLLLLIAPVSLCADYVITPVQSLISLKFIIPFIVIVLLIMLPLIFNFQSSIFNLQLVFGIIFLLLTLLPVYNIIPIVNPFSERYLYLSTVGFAIIVGSILAWLISNRLSLIVHCSLLIILSLYSFAVIQRNKVWADDYSLWSDTLIKVPESSRAHNNLGIVYSKQDKFDEATKNYLIAIRLKPDNAETYNNLGIVYSKEGKFDEAIKEYLTAIRIKPYFAGAYNNLGLAYNRLGQVDEAIKAYLTYLKFKPDDAIAHYNLAGFYNKKGLRDEVIKELEITLRLKPDFAPARQRLEAIRNKDIIGRR